MTVKIFDCHEVGEKKKSRKKWAAVKTPKKRRSLFDCCSAPFFPKNSLFRSKVSQSLQLSLPTLFLSLSPSLSLYCQIACST